MPSESKMPLVRVKLTKAEPGTPNECRFTMTVDISVTFSADDPGPAVKRIGELMDEFGVTDEERRYFVAEFERQGIEQLAALKAH